MGMLSSESGNESILKSVLDNEGLSGMILFEQERQVNENKTTVAGNNLLSRFVIVFQSKKITVIKRVRQD